MLEEKFESRKGLVTNISFSCSNPASMKSVLESDPYSPEATTLNNASIVDARLAGCGLHAMEVIMSCIGMFPPFTHSTWTKHNKDISIKACEVAKNSCVAATEHLHIVMGKPLDEVLDVVTVNGTWQKCGRTSLWYCCGYCLENRASIGMGGLFKALYSLQVEGRHGFGRL